MHERMRYAQFSFRKGIANADDRVRRRTESKVSEYPTEDRGFYHLTPAGWVRRDAVPYPKDRVETWSYQAIYLSDDAKERIWLTRIWQDEHLAGEERKALRGRFGMPVELQADRNITLQCDV